MYRACVTLAFAVLSLHYGLAQTQLKEIPFKFDTTKIANGQYNFEFRTPNQIERHEYGYLDNNGNYAVQGRYSYFNDLNQRVAYSYIADTDGYRAYLLPPLAVAQQGTGSSSAGFSTPAYLTAALLGG